MVGRWGGGDPSNGGNDFEMGEVGGGGGGSDTILYFSKDSA